MELRVKKAWEPMSGIERKQYVQRILDLRAELARLREALRAVERDGRYLGAGSTAIQRPQGDHMTDRDDERRRAFGLEAELTRLRKVEKAAREYDEAEQAWFLVSDARPYDPEAAALSAHKRRDALTALRNVLKETT